MVSPGPVGETHWQMNGSLRYAAIGDSIPRGFLIGVPRRVAPGTCTVPVARLLRWFDRPGHGYPAVVAEALRGTGRAVELDVSLTCSGAGTSAFWRGGPTAPVRDVFARRVDVATVTLGANDLMAQWSAYVPASMVLRTASAALPVDPQPVLDRLAPPPVWCDPAIRRLGVRLRGLLDWISGRIAGPVLVTTYYPGDGSDVVRARFIRPVNAAIRTAAAGLPGVRVVDLERLFHGHGASAPPGDRFVSTRDGLHPTDAGQRAIAAAIIEAAPELAGVLATQGAGEAR